MTKLNTVVGIQVSVFIIPEKLRVNCFWKINHILNVLKEFFKNYLFNCDFSHENASYYNENSMEFKIRYFWDQILTFSVIGCLAFCKSIEFSESQFPH